MFWQELYLGRHVLDDLLGRALAATFRISPEAIRVVDSVLDIAGPLGDDVQILVERQPTRGDFRLRVRVYLRAAELAQAAQQWEAGLELVKRFRGLVGTDCLLSDESPSAASWFLLDRHGSMAPVILDGDLLERDEYVVAGRSARAS
jgi:hypothetical protein